MSGGSFGYLCSQEPEELPGHWGLEPALAALREHGAEGAAGELASIAAEARTAIAEHEARLDALAPRLAALAPVLKALEWWQSRDWGEERFRAALEGWQHAVSVGGGA